MLSTWGLVFQVSLSDVYSLAMFYPQNFYNTLSNDMLDWGSEMLIPGMIHFNNYYALFFPHQNLDTRCCSPPKAL